MKSTPHINPTSEIAQTVLLPGDPLRAKYIAENFLDNPVEFNRVRNILGYTGSYKGKKISVMGTGMGVPSIGIYSWELINVFGVKNLIRVGSCGAMVENLKLFDIILAMGASTNTNYAVQYNLPGTFAPTASWKLLEPAKKTADELNINVHVGNVLTSDIFYNDDPDTTQKWAKMGVIAVEMEAAALYMNAARFNANALCMLTVSDNLITKEETNAKERETAFTNMMTLALETCNKVTV